MIKNNELYFAKTINTAIIPTKRVEDAGLDLYVGDRSRDIVILPNMNKMIDTGIATACHPNYFIRVMDKGGMGSKNITTSAGVIDSGYRGSIFVSLCNLTRDKYLILTTQDSEEIEKATHYDIKNCEFIVGAPSPYDANYISINDCIVKSIEKAITQIVVLPVPKMDIKEVSYDELQTFESERGKGKLGSSNK